MGHAKVESMTKAQIIGFSQSGRFTTKQIQEQLNVSRHCIENVKALYAETGNVIDRPRSGRPPIWTKHDYRRLVYLSRDDPYMSFKSLASLWSVGSARTVARRLKDKGLNSYVTTEKSLLTPEHRQMRLAWSIEHSTWTYLDWSNTHFSDESNFTVINRKTSRTVRRFSYEKYRRDFLKPKLQGGGGSIGIWGSMSWHGVDRCKMYLGRMDQWRYMDTLNDCVLPGIQEAKD